ncbi:MAG: extracellular solute-binding protein [Oscillospiraceae bacterium]|nr:extracellular solute-binding protein [Oscillospiraceae bacterium]
MKTVKRTMAILLSALLLTGICTVSAAAVNEDVEGTLGIYSSMYQFVIDMMDEALKEEFPNLTPAYDGSFFFYGGTSSLITKIYGEMDTGVLGCDMLLVAEPAFSLELKDADYLEPVEIEDADELLRFPYDGEGYWYPVRVCNMILAYNPEMTDEWAAKGVTIPHSFKDFASDPALKGYISMGDPMTSGTTFAAVASLTQEDHYGEAFLDWLSANEVMIESGSTAITKLQTGECAAIMILEESILKALKEAEDAGNPLSNLACIYPEDGVVLIPSTVMTVAEEHSANVNTEACEAVEQWLLSEEAQKLIVQGYMHSVFAGSEEIPWNSIDTEELIRKDLGVNWENAYRHREEINTAWTEKVTTR